MRWKRICEDLVIPQNFPWHLPQEYRDLIMSWPNKVKSPHSHSYYNVAEGEKSWEVTPLDSLRIANHWNFYTRGKTHCETDQPVPAGWWALGKWDGEKYEIISKFRRAKLSDQPWSLVQKMDLNTREQWMKNHGLTQPPE